MSNGIRVYTFGGVNANAYFNLNLGTVVAVNGSGATAKIESVGGGWYRCSITFNQTNVSLRFYPSDNGTTMVAGTVYIQEAQLESGDIATEPILTTTAAVSVGPVANVPRLDYLGSSCPRLNLEPQRTNLVLYSEQFDNAGWNKSASSVTANNGVSPDGYTNADLITSSGAAGYVFPSSINVFASAGGATYTYSVYLKAGTASTITVLIAATANYRGIFDLSAVTATTNTANTTPSIVSVGNGWYRCAIVCTSVASTAYSELQIGRVASGLNFLAYGAQLELGAYATSYIPTLGAAVTRGADACSKQNIAGTLPTEYPFTLYAQGFLRENNDVLLSINDYNQAEVYYQIGATAAGFFANARNATESKIQTSSGRNVGTHKVAAVFTSSEIRLFANGALIATGANGQTFNANANDVLLGQLRVSSDLGQRSSVNQALVFKSALSDADAIALTA